MEIAQIPLAWAIAKGTLPIIGVTKTRHVEDAAKAMSITLIKEETEEPEKAADHLAINTVRIGGEEMK